MKYLPFLFAAFSFCSVLTANGQGFQAGISAGYLMHLQPEPDGPGAGVQAAAWGSWALSPQSQLQFSVGHRRLGGFKRLSLNTEEVITSTETRRTVSAIQLSALHFVDAELGWATQFKPESSWSYYAAAYYARLVDWQDFGRGITSIEESGRRFGEGSDPNWPVRDELRSNDFGLCLGVSFQMLEGLSAQLRIRRGFTDLVPGARFTDSPKDHLAAFSFGLSARLR